MGRVVRTAVASCDMHSCRVRKALTGPEAEEVLRVARLDGAHGAVLDAHNRPFRVQNHDVRGSRSSAGGDARVILWVRRGGCVFPGVVGDDVMRARLRQRGGRWVAEQRGCRRRHRRVQGMDSGGSGDGGGGDGEGDGDGEGEGEGEGKGNGGDVGGGNSSNQQ